ncbi:MAG: prepilin peptidase [Clostridia bacterium]|nr:prepilin peptidase [Clostridia bacterium]
MMIFDAALLALLLGLGVVCSVRDFRDSTVPNRYLLIGLAAGAVCHIGGMLAGSLPFYPVWLANLSIAAVLAVAMYASKLWAAGDAKLFAVLYFLVPPRLIEGDSLAMAVVPYLFIFLPAFAWTLLDSLWRLLRKEPRKRRSFSPAAFAKGYGAILVETTALYCLFAALLPAFVRGHELLFSVVMVAYAFLCSRLGWTGKWVVVALHGLAIVLTFALGVWRPSPPTWQNAALILGALLLQRFASLYDYQLIPTASVKRGMILSAEAVFRFQASRVRNLPVDPSEEITARISETEAESVRRWGKSARGSETIWIVRKVPFAMMITLGFTLWMLFRMLR